MARKNEEQNGVSKKILNALPTGYQEEADGMSVGQLKDEISVASGKIEDNKAAMREDERLNGAKERVKDLSEGYREVQKAQNAKRAYCVHLLREKGQLREE